MLYQPELFKTEPVTPAIVYKPSEILGIIASFFSQLTAQHTQHTKDLNNAKDQAWELERQLNELKNKNDGNNLVAIITAVVITAILTAIICFVLT